MAEQGIESRREVVHRIFPGLRYGGDPSIERYFDLRKTGRMAEALAVYNRELRVRYPDDHLRIVLLGLYRKRDPRYQSFLESLLQTLGERLERVIKANIDVIVSPLEKADLSDALRALKTVEGILARLPRDMDSALESLERYDEFARLLGHRATLARRALDLVREYDTVSRADSPSEYDFVARSAEMARREAAAKRASAGRGASIYFDPRKIEFSASDRAAIEIPATLARREDRVLALCAKYWNRARDRAFERMVFLYSLKYDTRHYEVFRLVKLGRGRGDTDDEILSAISGVLSTSYSYSVDGDIYMQVMWRRLRARMEARAVAERLAIPGPESRTRKTQLPTTVLPKREASPPGASIVRPRSLEPALGPKGDRRSSEVAAKMPKTSLPTPSTPPPPLPTLLVPAASAAPLTAGPQARGAHLLALPPRPVEPEPRIARARGSISDRIRALSGKNYDVYRELFLEHVRDDIRRVLVSNKTKNHGLFDTAANEAEDQVFAFMTAHYEDPFMDWENSAERGIVEALGFSLPSLDPIVEARYRRLG